MLERHLLLRQAEPYYCCAVFYDKEFKENDVDVEVYKTVKDAYSDTEYVKFRTLPVITVASATCKGAYNQMGDHGISCKVGNG